MDETDEPAEEYDPSRFPLSLDDISKIERVIELVRERLATMTPDHLRSAAAVVLALERLPATTPGIKMTFGFVQHNTDGNFGWADISISADEFTLGLGEHFYDPKVGGDTESRHAFEAYAGGDSAEGDIDNWIPVAKVISADGDVDVEDYSDYEIIDWKSGIAKDEQ